MGQLKMFAEDRFETIQPIEGAKGNIAAFYYQGKYPINKSLDDDTYHLKSVMDAFRDSVNRPIAKEVINKWLDNDSTKRSIFYLLGIVIDEEPDDSNARLWYNTSKAKHLTALLSELRFRSSKVLLHKHQQKPQNRHLDGWYACEKLMLKFAAWLDEAFEMEIYSVFAMSAERERLHADINHKATRIEELERMLKRQDRKLDHVIEQNNQLLDDNSDMKDRLDCIHTHIKESSPIVVALNNRVSTEMSNEHLLLYLTEDGYELTVKVYAVNDKTLKKRGYDVNKAFAHIEGGNSVNMQNELFKLVEANNMLIEPICKRTKTFVMRSTKLNTLKRIIEYDLPERINETPNSIDDTIKSIDNRTETKRIDKRERYMGFDVRYCKKVCCRWGIDKARLTEIINGDWSTGDDERIILHESKGLLYEVKKKGKIILKPLPDDAFRDDD